MAERPERYEAEAVVWRTPDGGIVSCVEKNKVMSQNLQELRQLAQDALEDAILMGCDETQVRQEFGRLIDSLNNPYKPKR